MMTLTAEELLAGSKLTHKMEIPSDLLSRQDGEEPLSVVLAPLTVSSLQRISKATRDNDHENLFTALMIQQALVEPALSFDQVVQLPAGLARFLVEQINAISGISTARDELDEMVQAPLARACFVLAKEFGWTPEEISGMTIGQILLFIEMSRKDSAVQ